MLGSSEIWSEKLKLSYYKAHRVTEGTEVNAMSRRCRRHKERRRCSVQILDNFWDKCFGYRVSNKIGKLPPMPHAPTVPP